MHLEAAAGWIQLGDYDSANEELENIRAEWRAHPDVLELRWFAGKQLFQRCGQPSAELTSGQIHENTKQDMNKPSKTEDYWFKVVDMLQQNWALIELLENSTAAVYFFDDRSRIFDRMEFDNKNVAEVGLKRNGFSRFSDNSEAQQFIAQPAAPETDKDQTFSSGIYSSGEYWK
jgi:ABC-type phosphate/phosphonate transport system ATPase subunit